MKRASSILFIVLAFSACKNEPANGDKPVVAADTMPVAAPSPTVLNDSMDDSYKALQGTWYVATDPGNIVTFEGRTFNAGPSDKSKMNFTLSLRSNDPSADKILNERYAGEQHIWMLLEKPADMKTEPPIMAIVNLKQDEFTFTDAGSMGEVTYKRKK